MKTSKNIIKINESQLKQMISESVKKVLKEDHQNIPIQSIVDYLNRDLYYLQVTYDSKTDELTISSKEYVGLSDASTDNYLSSYFKQLSNEFKIIEKYTMGTIGFEVDGVNYDAESKNPQNMTLDSSNIYGTVTMDRKGGLKVLFKAKGHSNIYSWGNKINQYDKTNYRDGYWLKPNNKMSDFDKDDYDEESAIDNRDPRKQLFKKMDKMWQNQKEHEKYENQADKRPLHRKGSMNRDIMGLK